MKFFEDGFKEVHASNMSKLCDNIEDAETTQQGYSKTGMHTYIKQVSEKFAVCNKDNKVLKGINYFKPKLYDILGFDVE